MRYVDMENWSRREHFKLFGGFDHPHFGMCANVDLTTFYPAVKERGYSFSAAIMYVIARAANDIPEFRYRIRAGKVIEHEVVHPSGTILTDGDVFSFLTVEYDADFDRFTRRVAETVASVSVQPELDYDPETDNLLLMTSIPWVSFTGFKHPMHLNPADSMPRFAWGRFFPDGNLLRMPLDVQGHHALMDGIHVGRYFALLQDYLDGPSAFLGD